MLKLLLPLSAIILLPVLTLNLRSGANTCFGILLLWSLICLVSGQRPGRQSFPAILKQYWPLHLAMASLTLAVLASQLYHGSFAGRYVDTPARLAVFPLILWILLAVPPRYLQQMQWGCVAGAILAAVHIELLQDDVRLQIVGFTNAIPFGNLALLLGVFSFISLGWSSRHDRLAIFLKLAAAAAGLYASFLSQSRGGWMALPVFAGIAIFVLRPLLPRQRFFLCVLVLALGVGAYSLNQNVHTRIGYAVTETESYFRGESLDSSIGSRFQIWKGSLLMFQEHPLFGVGHERFPQALKDLAERRIITPAVAEFRHSHNEFLFNLATLGVPGLLAILAIYLVPAAYFLRSANHPDLQVRTAAALGLALCAGFLVFGLTEAMFVVSMTSAFYCLCAAVFLSFILQRRQLGSEPPLTQVRRSEKSSSQRVCP